MLEGIQQSCPSENSALLDRLLCKGHKLEAESTTHTFELQDKSPHFHTTHPGLSTDSASSKRSCLTVRLLAHSTLADKYSWSKLCADRNMLKGRSDNTTVEKCPVYILGSAEHAQQGGVTCPVWGMGQNSSC